LNLWFFKNDKIVGIFSFVLWRLCVFALLHCVEKVFNTVMLALSRCLFLFSIGERKQPFFHFIFKVSLLAKFLMNFFFLLLCCLFLCIIENNKQCCLFCFKFILFHMLSFLPNCFI
jgi:hypothetical protein